ncbi:Senescence domain-containing protein, partial [Cephalotus follicularis]
LSLSQKRFLLSPFSLIKPSLSQKKAPIVAFLKIFWLSRHCCSLSLSKRRCCVSLSKKNPTPIGFSLPPDVTHLPLFRFRQSPMPAGSGQLIKGILWCGDVTVDRLKWGNEFLMKRIGRGENSEISPETMKRIMRARENYRKEVSGTKGVDTKRNREMEYMSKQNFMPYNIHPESQ